MRCGGTWLLFGMRGWCGGGAVVRVCRGLGGLDGFECPYGEIR